VRRRSPVERITPLDMSNLRVEEHGLPMHVTALAVCDGEALLDDKGELRLPEIRARVAERIRGVDRLHQVLVWADGPRRRPVWRTAARFDITHHVLCARVPPPGDEPALLRLCSELNAPPLDRSRPLWQVWVIGGMPGRRVALLVRLHHVVADGLAALEIFSSILDPVPAPPPSVPEVQDVRRSAVRTAGRAAMQVVQGWDALRLGRAPALSWNRPAGPARAHTLVRADLAGAKTVAHANGGRVNDLVLAAVAGGARRLLESRGELGPDCDLHVSVAASIRRPGQSGGNRVGVRLVAVPVSEPDPAARLRTVAERTARQRMRPPLQPSGRLLQRWMVHTMNRQRMINMIVSNLPGPTGPLSFCGAAVREVFQLSPLQGNCTIGVGVLSYAGRLDVDVVGDPAAVPDLNVFADGLAEALEQLGITSEAPHPPRMTT
jgi:WS/DGAT/MGAT family acyltransferase